MSNRRRVYKIAERIQEIVALEIQRMADPRFEMVTITSVMVSSDLRNAKVYWIVSGDEERIAEVKEAFESAEGTFKRVLGKRLGIKFTPSLKFFYDDTLDTAEEVERLFARIKDGRSDHGKEESFD